MSSYEPHKMISLKLAGLSATDQRWILKHLPTESRERIKKSMLFVRKFRVRDTDSLFQKLLSHQGEGQGFTIENKLNYETSTSSALNAHLNEIAQGQVEVTASIKSFIVQYLARSSS